MANNNFLPFAPTDTGTNLLTQSDYAAASDRTNGNQPGVASSKLVNKALRQASYMASQLAQFVSNKTGTDLLDDAVPAKLLAQLNASMLPLSPAYTAYLSGSGTHGLSYVFFIASGNATLGATYTNNSITFTVKQTISSGLQLIASGVGAPAVSGVLTKASGTGDATLTFYAVRAPLYLSVRGVAGGGGGAPGRVGGGGGNGGNTTFGGTTATGGTGGLNNGGNGGFGAAGGSATLGSGILGLVFPGGSGNGSDQGTSTLGGPGGVGGSSIFGGNGGGSQNFGGNSAQPGGTNTGGGGGGGPGNSTAEQSGPGGGAGGGFDIKIFSPAVSYSYAVGAGGASSGTSYPGGVGGSGVLEVTEHYQ